MILLSNPEVVRVRPEQSGADKMSKNGFVAFNLICARPLENRGISPVVPLKNKPNPLSGWRLNSAQRDFIMSFYEIDQEKK
ncbi:hypothetical protein ACCW76_03380 [Pantoea sp. C8B4]|uniref:hypothetical protein n=1 Tax=Pantoea sp. C8B4 TaxID=3243083 RepID=UPI003EDA421D